MVNYSAYWPRLVADLVLGFSLVALPWWVSLITLLAWLILFPHYVEGLVATWFFELWYGNGLPWWGWYYFPLTSGVLILYWLVAWLRPFFR